MNKKSKIWAMSDEEFRLLIKNSNSLSEVLKKIGLSSNGGGSRSVINKRIKILNIDCSDLKFKIAQKRRENFKSIHEKTLEDIFSGKCEYISTNSLRKRLVREGVLEYKCSLCDISEWNGNKISLQLDHIDGDRKNNSLENLRILCPNCHSQTKTYAGKRNNKYKTTNQYGICKKCGKKILLNSKLCVTCNGIEKRKVIHPSKEELQKIIWEIPTSLLKVKFGVSDVAIAKWCKQYNIEKPPRGFWTKHKNKMSP